MTRDEFRKRIATVINGWNQNAIVYPETLRLEGDEDGDVCFSHEYSVDGGETDHTGYFYVNFEELMGIFCDD